MLKLIHGDCLEEMKKIPDGSIDMVLTDPPYGTTACKWDTVIPFEPMWEQLNRVIKPNGAIVMTASQPFTTTLIASNMKMFKYCWIWEKNRHSSPLLAKKQPLRNYEEVVLFYQKQPLYKPQGTKTVEILMKNSKSSGGEIVNAQRGETSLKGEYKQTTSNYPKQVQKFDVVTGAIHGTQKPVALVEYLIKTYTNEGETVLDFTMGSGTTGVACRNLNRNFIGIELDETYFNIAKERIDNSPEIPNSSNCGQLPL